ncbi:MAG TPA: hypothetical protein VFX65_01515 [Candidatus Limnocylindrales bacterium]|nr:hypothetical protein [Candidatus Limnocylindrales bacterium]
MMNDRFAAGLRQHLLDTADERPAEGQLAAVIERVAITAQRPPLAVRLAGFPGRIGPFPSTALRWGLIAAALLGATMAAAILGGGGGPVRSTVFEGTWTTIDPDDNSRMTLVVAAGLTPVVHFEDALSTGGACVEDPVKVFTADGTAKVAGSLLVVSFPDGGGCGLKRVDMGAGYYEYDEATDGMTDANGLAWFRAPEDGILPTQAPPVESTPITGCLEIPGGEWGFDVGGVVAFATFPSRWHAVDNGFHHIENGACGSSGSMRIDIGWVPEVYADSCRWSGTGVGLGDPTTTTAFSAQGFETTKSPETTIAGYPAARFDLSVPAAFDANACDMQTIRLWGEGPAMDPGLDGTVLLLQVNGVPIGIAATQGAEATQAELDELDAILASLRLVP